MQLEGEHICGANVDVGLPGEKGMLEPMVGAASKAFSRTLRELTKVYKPDLVILMETRCSSDNAKKAIKSFGFDFYHIEEAQGYSGGIWIMWKDPDLDIRVVQSKMQFVHMIMKNDSNKSWALTAVIEKPFRYEAMWSMHPGHKEFIKQAWDSNQPLKIVLNGTTRQLIKWNKDVFGHVRRQKRKIINRIEGIQRASSYEKNPFLEKLEAKLNKELEDILDKEKILWIQKSRDLWVVDEDHNTRYYHTRTVIRRRRNKILKLKD
ncbi:hypothetical protein Ahy_A02g007794 [Arachis hypogaea]|uniref:Endonuclease/exonuclease/phosphatase domain-containing protein n=1 Tax=Arachis hypogaea TaxID=3818 RepID=A0A445EDW4_ARAHY|nr:hypothetical protein Ahy_A02g007794 [Arachis hypogaea]